MKIDLRRIAGRPLRLGVLGWAISLALAYAIGGVLAAAGIVLSLLYTGSAIATTAIGTLIPILSDTGELRTRFGTYCWGLGRWGSSGRPC
jgi:Kef-type K+ transport system membrane component KefB